MHNGIKIEEYNCCWPELFNLRWSNQSSGFINLLRAICKVKESNRSLPKCPTGIPNSLPPLCEYRFLARDG